MANDNVRMEDAVPLVSPPRGNRERSDLVPMSPQLQVPRAIRVAQDIVAAAAGKKGRDKNYREQVQQGNKVMKVQKIYPNYNFV